MGKNLCRKIMIAAGAALFPAIVIGAPGFAQTNAAAGSQVQTSKAPSPSAQSGQADAIACRFAGVSYAEGTVIHGERIPEQMCVRAPNPDANGQGQGYHAEWIRTSKEARERISPAIVLPDAPDRSLSFFCQPTAGDKKGSCGCEGSADFPVGAMARSGKGAMLCSEGGWRPLLSCVAHNTEYPEGSVIRTGDSNEQLCVRVLNLPFDRQPHEGHLDWVRTSKELQDRSSKSLSILASPVVCKPVPAKTAGNCGCEGFSDFAPKSILPTANGRMLCEGGEWKPIPQDSAPK